MEAFERKIEMLRILCRRRHESITNLAHELGVSVRTVQRDIDTLSLIAPLYTKSGRYDGGVYLVENYSMDRMYMKASELVVLHKILTLSEEKDLLTPDERRLLKQMLLQYTKPVVSSS